MVQRHFASCPPTVVRDTKTPLRACKLIRASITSHEV